MKKNNSFLLSMLLLLFVALTSFSGCGKNSNSPESESDILSRPSSFPAEAPQGNDALSSSTNHSSKANSPGAKASGLSGASFVSPPSIGNTGTVNLTYPIAVPAGRGGTGPSISLRYSSNSGDGITGMGWKLSIGLGSITRSIENGELYYDYRDTFLFNGHKLVKVDGASNTENGIYRLEIESDFSRFELTDADNGGVWRVYDKSGAVSTYGLDNAKIYHPENNKTYTWHFSRIDDLNGNYIYATYDSSDYSSNHIIYLNEIRYTGNSGIYGSALPARQYIRFSYKEREESYVTKAPGFIVSMDQLLDSIEAGWDDSEGSDDTLLWKYSLVYEDSEESGKPLLQTVNSTRNTTQPEFIYEEPDKGLFWEPVNNTEYSDEELNPKSVKYFHGDFNGDGISDILFFNPVTGYWKVAESKFDGGFNFKTYGNKFRNYDTDEEIQWFKVGAAGDYNGNGRTDVAFYLPETREFWVAESTGRNFNFRMYGRLSDSIEDIFKCEWFTGDYDGNGLSDVVLYNEKSGEWIFMQNTHRSFSFIKFSEHFKNLFRDDYDPDSNMDSESTTDISAEGNDRDKVRFLYGDFNGDSRTDISIYDARDGKWWVAENIRDDSGTGFSLEWSLYKEFTAPERALFSNEYFTGDFTNDGFSDFLLYDRDSGEWILGETLDGTINFTEFAQMPSGIRNVTKWIQGDFNGDGRIDVGFFSADDNNFWVGESQPGGLRFRIYNDFSSSLAPDIETIMKSPAPEDDVKPAAGKAIVTGENVTVLTEYTYNANNDLGEKVFAGNFSGSVDSDGMPLSELLVYKKDTGKFYSVSSSTETAVEEIALYGIDILNTVMLDSSPVKIDGKDRIRYYETFDDEHYFREIYYNGSSFESRTIAEFSESQIPGFDFGSSAFLLDDFAGQSLLVFDNEDDTVSYLVSGSNITVLSITGSFEGSGFTGNELSGFRFFSGRFTAGTGDPSQILLVNTNESDHEWHLGTIVDDSIEFVNIGYSDFADNYTGYYHVRENGTLVYSSIYNSRVQFHSVEVTDYSVAVTDYSTLAADLYFYNNYTHSGNPVVFDRTNAPYSVELSGTYADADELEPDKETEIQRQDLFEEIYPFNWIGGDFNGDGKTDVAIIHLKEKKWYFANSTGNTPDIINKVNNGIGGTYKMEYENAVLRDNTGDDSIPDLPLNYKVCTKLTVSDGINSEVSTYYDYKGMYTYCEFVDGEKEIDTFGFSEFTTNNALGQRTVNYYYNVPYDDYRKNRALAGAIKQTSFYGSDNKEYSRIEFEYLIHEIVSDTDDGEVKSYVIDLAKKQSYSNGVLVRTDESNTVLADGKYQVLSKTGSTTDHYSDSSHAETEVTSYSEFETIENTNETRVSLKKNLAGTSHETTAEFEYDSRGNLVLETLSYTGSGLDAVQDKEYEYVYDDYGNRIKTLDKSGTPEREGALVFDTTMYQFVLEKKARIGTGTDDYLTTTYELNYDIAFGSPEKITGPNGNSVYYEYDSYGRIIRTRADTDSGIKTLADYSYDTDFPLSSKTVQYSGTGEGDIETRVYSDGLGRGIHTIRSAMDTAGKRYLKSGMVKYDAIGRVEATGQTDWAIDDEINKFRKHTKLKYPTYYYYDEAGRKRKVVSPQAYTGEAETSTTYTYNDPWETVITHSSGRIKRTVVNAREQVLYTEDSGTGDDGEYISSRMGFAYSISGKLIKRMDLNSAGQDVMDTSIDASLFTAGAKDTGGNNIAQWKYDGFGRLKASSDPDIGYSAYEYNAFGDLISKTDALSRTTTMSYDAAGRMTEKQLPGDEGSVTYTYDEYTGSDNALGKLVMIEDSSQRKIFSYDKLGHRKNEIRHYLNTDNTDLDQDFITNYSYDLLDRTTRIEYPQDPRYSTSTSVNYTYNGMGLVNTVNAEYGDDEEKTIVSGISYNEFGQMTSIVNGNGVTTDYEYDIKGRLSYLESSSWKNEQLQYLQRVNYSFNIDNSIRSIEDNPTETVSGETVRNVRYNYSYDGLNRLISAQGSYEEALGTGSQKYSMSFDYAQNGNLLKKCILDPDTGTVQDEWNYSYSNHAATSIDTTDHGVDRFIMQYDALGNMVYQEDNSSGLKKEIDLDSRSRISQVTDPDSGRIVGEYYYDDQGFRVRRISRRDTADGGREFDLIYPSKHFSIEVQRDEYGNEIADTYSVVNNIYLNGVRIASILPAGDAVYYLTDQVDSVKVVVDDNALAVSRMEYKPYGEAWVQEGDTDYVPKYNSQELDQETGFYFYNARHYDPQIARFVSPDSSIDGALDTQGWNRYAYCKGNPINYRDPSGHYGIPNISISGSGLSIGISNIYGSPFGAGVTIGWGDGFSAGVYGEVGYGAYTRVGIEHNFKHQQTYGYVSQTVGIGMVSASVTSRYNLTKGEYVGTSINVGVGPAQGNSGMTAGVTLNFDKNNKYAGYSLSAGYSVANADGSQFGGGVGYGSDGFTWGVNARGSATGANPRSNRTKSAIQQWAEENPAPMSEAERVAEIRNHLNNRTMLAENDNPWGLKPMTLQDYYNEGYLSRESYKINDSNRYFDINLSLVVFKVGITTGVMISPDNGFYYPYIGGTVASSAGVSFTYSGTGPPKAGNTISVQGYLYNGGQVGVHWGYDGTKSGFIETGYGSPGVGISAFHVFDPN